MVRETTRVPSVIVARVEQLAPLVGHQVRIDGWDYAVWLLPDGSVQVLDNSCEHVGGPIVDGAIEDGCVICPWHGWRYELVTGRRRTAIGDFPGIGWYPARVVDGDVVADLPDPRRR
jgi:nitrite reductase/ring-hydroxylating ferredoxin subunit